LTHNSEERHPVKIAPWVGAIVALGLTVSDAAAGGLLHPFQLKRLNNRLHGQVVDHTNNHGHDRRIWSAALHQARDLYVYLPPGYDPAKRYPVAVWLHAFRQDEEDFLQQIVTAFDDAMSCGQLPPFIVVCPDGTIQGESLFLQTGSFFVNSKAGCFEDYIIRDVWSFVVEHYSVRPEREAHLMMGASMGGFGAYNLAIKHRDNFKLVVGLFPPVNLRWVDCHERYRSNFDPCCWGWRHELRPHEVIARFYGIPIRMWQLVKPIYGLGPDAIPKMSDENPIELLEKYDVRPGQLDMYIAYAGKDEFNIDAQVESFLEVARRRSLEVGVGYEPNGRHNIRTGLKLFPGIADWLSVRLAPYAP
jgi:S-formylglutathione hydrolase FrmB